jgi:hypothetical protein
MRATIKSTKWYGRFWPPERKKVKVMQALLDYYEPEITPKVEKAVSDWQIYGIAPPTQPNPHKEGSDE